MKRQLMKKEIRIAKKQDTIIHPSNNKYEITNDNKCHQSEGNWAPLYSTGTVSMVDMTHGSGSPSVKQLLIQLLGPCYLQGSRRKTSSKDTFFPWVVPTQRLISVEV